MSDKVNLREESKRDWVTTPVNNEGYPGDVNLKLGCLMRIADASEKMAINHSTLLLELERAKIKASRLEEQNTILIRQVRALRGVITKLKKRIG